MKSKLQWISALLVPAGLFLFLAPYSMLIGWNLFSAALCWFIAIPTLAIFLPLLLSKYKFQFTGSLMGLLVFYGLMVFLIYDHYKSDFFFVVILGCAINLGTVLFVSWIVKSSQINKTQA